jgi:FixJ family two-component response regulator
MCGASDISDGGPLIVVLDPDDAVREALRFSLETEGYRVRAFGAAKDLLACLQTLDADCFVIDEAGCDAQLRVSLCGRRAPVILLSGRPDRAPRLRAWSRMTLVEKPLITDALSVRIAAVLRAEARPI